MAYLSFNETVNANLKPLGETNTSGCSLLSLVAKSRRLYNQHRGFRYLKAQWHGC